MTKEKADQLVELLVKLVKLQRLMKCATMEQRDLVIRKSESVIAALVDHFGADVTWCNALLTFGGQYFGQDTKFMIGDGMEERTVADALRREVYTRYGLGFELLTDEEKKISWEKSEGRQADGEKSEGSRATGSL